MFILKRVANPHRSSCDRCANHPKFLNIITTGKHAGTLVGLRLCAICTKVLWTELRNWIGIGGHSG